MLSQHGILVIHAHFIGACMNIHGGFFPNSITIYTHQSRYIAIIQSNPGYQQSYLTPKSGGWTLNESGLCQPWPSTQTEKPTVLRQKLTEKSTRSLGCARSSGSTVTAVWNFSARQQTRNGHRYFLDRATLMDRPFACVQSGISFRLQNSPWKTWENGASSPTQKNTRLTVIRLLYKQLNWKLGCLSLFNSSRGNMQIFGLCLIIPFLRLYGSFKSRSMYDESNISGLTNDDIEKHILL